MLRNNILALLFALAAVLHAETIKPALPLDGLSAFGTRVAFVRPGGTSAGAIGNPARPYSSAQAAYAALAEPVTLDVANIYRTDTTAMVSTVAPHHLSVGSLITISGAAQSPYNGPKMITSILGSNIFTVAVSGSPASPATGTITATGVQLGVLDLGIGVWNIFLEPGIDWMSQISVRGQGRMATLLTIYLSDGPPDVGNSGNIDLIDAGYRSVALSIWAQAGAAGTAENPYGGAGGSLTLTDGYLVTWSVGNGGSAYNDGEGAAIDGGAGGSLTLRNSICLSGGTAGIGGEPANAGFYGAGGSVVLENSQLTGSVLPGSSGSSSDAGSATVTDSTISGSLARSPGGNQTPATLLRSRVGSVAGFEIVHDISISGLDCFTSSPRVDANGEPSSNVIGY